MSESYINYDPVTKQLERAERSLNNKVLLLMEHCPSVNRKIFMSRICDLIHAAEVVGALQNRIVKK